MSLADLARKKIRERLSRNKLKGLRPSSQSQLAGVMGWSTQHLSKTLASKGDLTLETLERFARSLGASPAELISTPHPDKPSDLVRTMIQIALEEEGLTLKEALLRALKDMK